MLEQFDLSAPTPHAGAAAARAEGWPRQHAQREPSAPLAAANVAWLTCMLDEVDYGMLLLTTDAQVLFMNHAARIELGAKHPLQLLGQSLRAQRPQDVAPLYDALAAAQRGLRRLVHLGDAPNRISLSAVPLPAPLAASPGPLILLVLGKHSSCGALSVQAYARSVRLTPAETRVMELLCDGVQPLEIAEHAGVAVSTVRTQIGSIRAKTGATSIRDLVRQVALLPPMVGVLRVGSGVGMGVSPGRGAVGQGLAGSAGPTAVN
jgi:DNA-binding CsgD family transcriptional regulator